MSDVTWTPEELAEFDRITLAESSRRQIERVAARLELRKFIALHGREKCDAMFAELTKSKPRKKAKK